VVNTWRLDTIEFHQRAEGLGMVIFTIFINSHYLGNKHRVINWPSFQDTLWVHKSRL